MILNYFDGGRLVAAQVCVGLIIASVVVGVVVGIIANKRPVWGQSSNVAGGLFIGSILIFIGSLFVLFLPLWPMQASIDHDRHTSALEAKQLRAIAAANKSVMHHIEHNYRTVIQTVHSFKPNLKVSGQGDITYRLIDGRECSAAVIFQDVIGWVIVDGSAKCVQYEDGAYPGAVPK